MMFPIVPYKSIGELELNSSMELIEAKLGKGWIKDNPYVDDTELVSYGNGIHIEFKLGKVSFIGVMISLNPYLGDYFFINHSFDEIVSFFRTFPGKIYTDDTAVISDHLGITTYFEDERLLEIGIFAKEYKEQIIGNLETT